MNKKKTTIILIIISILLVLSAILTSTYALFYNEKVAANPSEYSTGLLSIEALTKGETLSLTDALPMEDSEGIEQEPYVFTIRNNGNLDYTFDVKLLSTSSNTINPSYIKLKIDNGEVTTLSDLNNSIIKNNITLKAKESIDISIRVWLSMDTKNTEIGKTFTSNLVIDGMAVYTETNNLSYDGAAGYIFDLFAPTGKVVNNNITYEVNTENSLIEDQLGNIRYYGADPNNYIKFNCEEYPDTNCEIWRIIGVIDGKLKLIRNELIGVYPWDTSAYAVNSGRGINQWGESTYSTTGSKYAGADLMKLLNPGYESVSVGGSLYYTSGSGTCYSGAQNATKACDFTNTGIKNDATRNKIAHAIYYTGIYTTFFLYPNSMLLSESGNTVSTDLSDNVIRTAEWTGKIAVPNPSDYGYAVDLSICKNKLLGGYGDSTCTANNWMKNIITNNGSNQGWFLNPYKNNTTVLYIRVGGESGYGGYEIASDSRAVIPTLYLEKNEIIIDGNGTISNPYKLSD